MQLHKNTQVFDKVAQLTFGFKHLESIKIDSYVILRKKQIGYFLDSLLEGEYNSISTTNKKSNLEDIASSL